MALLLGRDEHVPAMLHESASNAISTSETYRQTSFRHFGANKQHELLTPDRLLLSTTLKRYY